MSKIIFSAMLLVGLVAQAASVPVRSFNSLAELSSTPAPGVGITVLLNGYVSTNNFGQPIAYRHRPDLSTSLHNPPGIIKEVNSNGVWRADFLDSGVIDARVFGVVADGTTDNTTALQAGIYFCFSNNIPDLVLPDGIVRTGPLTITNNLFQGGLALHGAEGVRARLQATGIGSILNIANCRSLTFHDIMFDGNNTSTNLINIDNCTQVTIERNFFFSSAGNHITMTGVQNYGHRISGNMFATFAGKGVSLEATSVTKMIVDNNVFDSTGFNTTAVGLSMKFGVASVTSFNNVYQDLLVGIDNRGSAFGSNLRNLSMADYFELCTLASVRLGADGQITGFAVKDAFFNVQYTTNQYAVIDGGVASQMYGFEYTGNTVTPDAGKAVSLDNLVGTGWSIQSAATDFATDYSWNTNFPVQFRFGNQQSQSVLVTNFSSVAAGSTNMSLVMFRVPDYLAVNPLDTNSAVTIAGSMPHGSKLTIRNLSARGLTFASNPIGQNIDETFYFLDGTWRRSIAPYLLLSGGTVSGSVTITNALSVGGNVNITGNATVLGNIENSWGYFSSGGYGGTNIAVFAAKAGAVGVLMKDGAIYAFFGTNGVTRFMTSIEMPAANDTLNWVAGWNSDPTTGTARLISTPRGSFFSEGNGISISSTTISGDYVPGSGIGFSTNGSGQITISNTGTNSGAGSTNGSALYIDSAYAQTGNFIDSPELDPSISGTNVTFQIVANSIATNKVDSTFRSFFLDRANHTGTQTASTISDFADVQWAAFTNSMVASNNISFAYDTSNKKLMISSTGGGGSATNAPVIAVDGVVATNVNFADSSELLVTKTSTNVTYALNTNGVAAGTYGGVTLTVNSKGLITSITSGTNTGWVTNQVDRPIFITMDAVTIASAVTNETSILGKFGANQTNIITANVLASNKVIRIKASGTFTPPGSDWSGAYVRVKFGGRILTGQIAEMNSTQPSPGAWFLEASMHVRGSGSNATNVIVGYFANQESEPIANSGANIIALVPSGTLDTTINNTLDITFQNEATQPLAFTCNHAEAYYLGDDMITGGGVLTALDASWIVQGTLDAARMPSSVLLDSEAALLYGGLNNNNTWTGTQTFTNDVDFLGDVSFNMLTVGTFQSTTWTNLGDVTVGSNLVVSGSISLGGVARTNWPTGGGGSSITINGSGTLTNIADGADITLATSGGTTATPTLTDTGVTNGTYTLSANGNTATVDAKGRITAIEDFDDVNDFDLVDEFVGPSTYTLFNPAANSGSTAAGGVATTLTNLLGTRWIMTSGSNQYPILVCSAPFKNAGMRYVQFAMRFYFPLLSTDADPWEFQMGIYDSATTTNRPVSGSWITANTNLGNANFFLCNGTNSTYNYVDTGIPMTATNWHDWAVRMTPSNSIALYGLTPVATNSLNYPTSTYFSLFSIRMSRFMHTASAQRYIYVDNGRLRFRSGPGR